MARKPYPSDVKDDEWMFVASSAHDHPIAPNRLKRNFVAERPNAKWAADLTYIPTGEGWLYLAAALDLYSRRIVGWAMADHLRSELAIEALNMAIAQRRPRAGLIHHSDRGAQYACQDYQRLLARHGIIASMSGVGNCYDNAAMESFFSTLKTECVHRQKFAAQEEARRCIFEYVEVIYNRKRPHSSLGYVSPESFEAAAN